MFYIVAFPFSSWYKLFDALLIELSYHLLCLLQDLLFHLFINYNFFSPMRVFRKVNKWNLYNEGSNSGEYARWFKMSQPNDFKRVLVAFTVCGLALLCNKYTPFFNIPLRLFLITLLNFCRDWHYRAVVIVSPETKNQLKWSLFDRDNLKKNVWRVVGGLGMGISGF